MFIDISKFLYRFGFKHSIYSGYIQHDALEFFRLFIDDISIELNENKQISEYKEINYTDETSKIQCKSEFDNISLFRENLINNVLNISSSDKNE